MPLIANLTLAQLRAATKAQIITAIANYLTSNFTKRQLIGFLIDADAVADPPARTYRTDGQIESETIDTRDAETGSLVSSRQVRWSYYPTGEVDTIAITEGSTTRRIKHYLNGQPPTVTTMATVAMPLEEETEELDPLQVIVSSLAVLVFAALAYFFR